MKSSIRMCAAVLCVGLAACNTDIKETLGLNRKGPDAFQVYSHPPLTMPPEYSLQPPGKGPEFSSGTPADIQAHNQILGTSNSGASALSPAPTSSAPASPAATTVVPANSTAASVHYLNSPTTGPASTAVPAVSASELPTGADAQFLADVGASKADPHIREELDGDKDKGPLAKKSSSYLFDGKSAEEPTVDSTKEADRLKQDKAQDKPPTAGETPVVTPPDKGILGDIF